MIAPLFGGRSDIEILALLVGRALERATTWSTTSCKGARTDARVSSSDVEGGALTAASSAAPMPRPMVPPPAVRGPTWSPRSRASRPSAARPEQPRDRLRARSEALRRPPREQPVAPRAPGPDDEDRLGQRRDPLSRDREGARRRERRRRRRSRARASGRSRSPSWILPGQADNVVTVNVGWGRTLVGPVRQERRRRTSTRCGRATRSASPTGATLAKTGKTSPARADAGAPGMEGRPLAIDATLEEYRKNPELRAVPDARSEGAAALEAGRIQGAQVGDGHRPLLVHRAATLASSPARPRTTSPRSARTRSTATARCTGSASTATSSATTRTSRSASRSSPSPACSARTRPARTSARSTPRRTAPRG